MRARPVLLLSLTAVAVLALAALGIVLRTLGHTRQMLHPQRVPVTAANRREAEAALGPLEDVALTTSDGLTLHGWYAPSKNRAAVVMVPGLGGNRMGSLAELAILGRRGFGALLYDPRGQGESDGTGATWGDLEQLDLGAALDLLSARADVDPKRLGVIGFSVGSTAVAMRCADDRRAAAVLLEPTWTSMDEELAVKFGRLGALSRWVGRQAFLRAGVHVSQLRPIEAVPRIRPRPLLFLCGDKDLDTPLPIMLRMQAAVPGTRLVVIPGAGHGGYAQVAPELYQRELTTFFSESLLH